MVTLKSPANTVARMEANAFLLLLILSGTAAGPVSWRYEADSPRGTGEQCAAHCTGATKFFYDEGKTYKYEYAVSTVTSMHEASDGAARIEIKANADIHVLSKCDLVLSLSNVRFMKSEPNSPRMQAVDDWEFRSELENKVLRFSFQDGKVEDVCPTQGDSAASLNLKRGILSAFQNSMNQHERDESVHEMDVTGTCPTQYSVQKGWKTSQFSKVKDLLGCSDRHDYKTSLQSSSFHLPDAIQSLPLLKGNHKCTQTVSSEGHVVLSTCVESLVFRPFSKKEAGARTETTQTLKHLYTTSERSARPERVSKKTTLLFEHSLKTAGNDQTLWSAKDRLTQLCRITLQDIPAETPELFTELVYLMRSLDSQEFMDIAERVHRGNICDDNKEKAKKFFLDALPMVGTASSVEVMVELLLGEEVTGAEAELWFLSLNFIHHPTLKMISHLKRLLISDKLRMSALLPVTSLVNNYCQASTDCMITQEVGDIVDILADILGKTCDSSDEELTLLTLRAAGNLGHSDMLVPILGKCLETSAFPTNTRVLAAQAFRGVTCEANRQSVIDIFMSTEEDSELRINAYLAAMQCPTEMTLTQVKKALEAEPVNQVGSFVWTHLTNLMETASPHKQGLREILEDDKLKAEFDMDKRKYSRNYELSFFSEKFGTGAMAESNVIFSSKSFLPRSAMLNLTVDMLGHSVNLLEVGGRVQGLEVFLQKYLSSGLFGTQGQDDTASPSRCVKRQKMERMKEKLAVDKDELTASMYVRVFGNELGFHHFNEKELMSLKDKMNTKAILSSLAKESDISFTKTAMFMDTEVSVPTIAGMALKLSVNGSASVELIASGKMDLRKLSRKRMYAMFDVKPSGAVHISGLMSLDAGLTRAGLKMTTTLHTSTAISGSIDLTNGQVLSVDFDTPRDQLEILDVKSEIFIVHDQVEQKQGMSQIRPVKKQACTSNNVLKFTGYELCGDVSFIKSSRESQGPYFPFNGPVAVSVMLNKRDIPKGFKLIGKYIQNEATAVAQFSIDTPGSRTDRAINIGYFLDTAAKSAEFEFNNPWKKLLAKGSYSIEPTLRTLSATLIDDGREHIMLLKVERDEQVLKTVWRPTVEISRPEDSKVLANVFKKFTVGGTVEMDNEYKDIAADIVINSDMKPNPIQVQANYINKERQKTIAGSVTLNQKDTYSATAQVLLDLIGNKGFSGNIQPTILISVPKWRPFLFSGSVDYTKDRLVKGDVQLTMDRTLKQPIALDFKLIKQSRKSGDKFRSQAKLNSQFGVVKSKGIFTVNPTGNANKKDPLMTGKVSFDYDIPLIKNIALKKDKLIISSKVHDRSSNSLKKYSVNVNLGSSKNPDANLITNIELSHKKAYTKAFLTMRQGAKAKYTKDKSREIQLGLSLDHKISSKAADIRYDVQLIYPLKDIEYQLQGKHEHTLDEKFYFETYVSTIIGKGKNMELRIGGRDDSTTNRLDASGLFELSFPSLEIEGTEVDGQSYKLSTTIEQTAEQAYVHTVNVQTSARVKHSVVTKYKKLTGNDFEVYSQIQINGNRPAKLTLSAQLDSKKMETFVEFVKGNKLYSAEVNSHLIGDNNYKTNTWDIIIPERRVKGSLEGGEKTPGEYSVKFITQWDADHDPSQKIDVDMLYVYQMRKKSMKYESQMMIKTPFENHKIYEYQRVVEVSDTEAREELKFVYGIVENEVSYKVWLRLPPSLERLEMKAMVITPAEAFRKGALAIVHKLDKGKRISTSVKGNYNDDDLSVTLIASNTGDMVRNNFDGSLSIMSSIEKIKNIALALRHEDDGRKFKTEFKYDRNGQQYSINLDTTYVRVHYQVQLDSKLRVLLPRDSPLTVKWVHTNTLTNLNSTFSIDWKPEYNTKLTVGMKVNKAEKDYAVDAFFSTPLEQFQTFEVRARHNGMADLSGSCYLCVNRDPKMTFTSSYKYTKTESEIKASSGGNIHLLKVKYSQFPYTVYMENTWVDEEKTWEEQKIVLDASVDENFYHGWLANAKLMTPFNEYRNVDLRGEIKKLEKSGWNLDTLISMDVRKQISVKFNVDTDGWTAMDGVIKTPYKEMTSLSWGYSRSNTEKAYDFSGYMEILPIFNKVKMEQTIRMNDNKATRLYISIPDTDLKFIELNADVKDQRRGTKASIKVNYHPDKEIDLQLTSKYNKNKFPENSKLSLDLSTPFDILPSLNFKTSIDKDNEKWIGLIDLRSSAEELQYFNVKAEQASTDTSCHCDFEIASSVFETVAAGMHFDWGDMAGVNLTLKAPSVGRSMIGFKKKSNSWTDFQNKVFMEIDGYDLDMDIGLKHDEKETKAWLTYLYPGADHSYLKTSVHRVGDTPSDFDVGGFFQVGRQSKPYNVSMQYAYTDNKYALGTTLETPYTKSLSYLLSGELLEAEEFNCRIHGKYDEKFLLDSVSSVKLKASSLSFDTNSDITYDANVFKSNTKMNADWSEEGEEATFEGSCNENWVKIELNRKVSTNGEHVLDVLFFSPYEDFTDVGLHAVVNNKVGHHQGRCSLEFMDEKEALLTFDLNQEKKNRLSLSATLKLPVEGYERNSLIYNHLSRKKTFAADAEVTTGKGQHLLCKVELKNREDFTLSLTGPIEDFESMGVTLKLQENNMKLNGNAYLKLATNSQPVSLDYDITTNEENDLVIMTYKVRSPYEKVRRVDLDVHFKEEDGMYKTTSVLKSNELGIMNNEMMWTFKSPSDIELSATLTSSVENMDNLKFIFNSKKSDDSHKSHLEVGWNKNKQIISDHTWLLLQRGSLTKVVTSLELTTPFEDCRTAGLKLSHRHQGETLTDSVMLHHNGKTYADADLDFKYGDHHEGTVDVRHPRPMSLYLTGTSNEESLDGKVILNWDKQLPEAHMEVLIGLVDKSGHSNIDKNFMVKFIHPVRIMGLDCLYKQANNELLTSGQVTWDKQNGKTFLYDFGWGNHSSRYSRMYEVHAKLGVPNRSMKVQSSYSDTGTTVTTSSAVLWDADKDETKKATMTASVESKDSMKRVGLNINLPYINKQLNMGVSSKEGYGSSLMDTKAEISYSSDPRKTIVVTSQINNAVTSDKYYNYTTQIGFKHPITDIDLELTSHIANMKKTASAGVKFMFLTALREWKTLEMFTHLDKTDKKMEMKLVTPIKNIRVEGKFNEEQNGQHLSWMSFEEEQRALRLDVIVDSMRKNLEVEFNYDKDDAAKMVSLSGRYINDSAIQVDLLSYQTKRRFTSESMIAIRLNSSNVMHTRVLWRPQLFNELQTFLGTKVTEFSYASNEAFTQAVESVGIEVKAKYLRISDELRTEMNQVFILMEKEMKTLSEQLETLKTQIRRSYNRNDLYIRDMGEQAQKSFSEFLQGMKQLVRNYHKYYISVTSATSKWMEDMKSFPISQKYTAAVQEVITGLEDLKDVLEATLNDVVVEAEKFSEVSYKKYLEISRAIDRKLNSYTRSIHELPVYRTMLEQQKQLAKMGENIMPGWSEAYQDLYMQSQEILQDQFQDMMNRPEFQHIYSITREAHQQIMHWNMEQSLNMAVRRAADLFKNLLLMELSKLKNQFIDLKKSRIIVFDPEEGELQFELHLPVHMKSLLEPPKFKVNRYLKDMKQWVQTKLPSTEVNVWDLYYQHMPSLQPTHWIPPFDASAYLIGSQHIISFDQKYYSFLSQCNHVLARDMLNDSFSVVVNYDNAKQSGVNSLCFLIENSLNFQIYSDYKLVVNNRQTEMPFFSDKVKVVREGDLIRMDYAEGVEVICNPKLDMYKVTVSGWYHGRLTGLLGSYDNEPGNDLMTDDQMKNIEVNRKSCASTNIALTPNPNSDKDGECTKFFVDNSSKYRSCFKQVDPAPFLNMCQLYMSSMTAKDAVHRATEQYRYVCQGKGVFTGSLKEYTTCGDQETLFVDNTDPRYQSADVLFVIEDSECNQWASSSLASMVTEIDTELNNAGMMDNRFALEGYGGHVDEPVTTRTIDGQMFGKASHFLRAVETLQLQNSGSQSDVRSAIRSAMKYTFRPGVAKVMVIAPCSSYEVGFLQQNVANMLKAEGFSVHILQKMEYSLDSSSNRSPRRYRIYGTDNSHAFTNRITETGITPQEVKRVNSPDFYSTLAKTTNGSMFDIVHFDDKSRVQREFIKSFAHRVGSGTNLPKCQRCQCDANLGQFQCHLCELTKIDSYVPWNTPSVPHVVGYLQDFHHDMKTYLGLRK